MQHTYFRKNIDEARSGVDIIETVKTAFFWSFLIIVLSHHFFLTKVTVWWPKARNEILWSEERRFHCFKHVFSLTVSGVGSCGTARSELDKVALKIQEMPFQRPKNSETSGGLCPRAFQKSWASRSVVTHLGKFMAMCLCPPKTNALAAPVLVTLVDVQLQTNQTCPTAGLVGDERKCTLSTPVINSRI